MIQTYIYTILMVILALIVIIKKYNKMGIVLILLYAFVSIIASVTVRRGNYTYQTITLFPYLFLLSIYIIVFVPFLNQSSNFNIEKLSFNLNTKYYLFANLFIITSLLSIIFYLPKVRSLLISGAWDVNRASLYNGLLTFDTTWYQYYALQFSGYTRILGMLLGFSILRNNTKVIIGWSCIILGIVTEILNAMYTSSRGSIVNIVLLTIVMYIFFYNTLKNDKKRFGVILSGLAFVVIIPYVIDVTMSRFSSYGAVDSVIEYFGQSPVVFNYGVAPMQKHMYGMYALGKLFNDSIISQEKVGGAWGSGFYTFVGWMFIDWGYFGTLFWAIVLALIINKLIKKDYYSLADLFLIFFVYYSLLQGVFVIGRSYIYNIIMTIFIYLFIKIFFDKYSFVIGNIK